MWLKFVPVLTDDEHMFATMTRRGSGR
jgi:hypothetical protein